MQTARTQTRSATGTTDNPTAGTQPPRNGSKTTHNGSPGDRYAFLRKPIPAIAPPCVTPAGSDENLITRERYEYLRDSYFRYARLMDAVPHHVPADSYAEGIARLYDEMRTLVEPSLNVNIEHSDDGRLSFALWHIHQWGQYNIYWLPVQFVERLRPEFRRLVITFLHELKRSNRLLDISSSAEAEYVLEMMKEYGRQSVHAWEIQEMDDNILSYESGRAHRLLQRIDRRCYYKNLPRALARHGPQDASEQALLDIMRDGMQFIGDDKPALMGYDYDSEWREEPEFLPIGLDLLIGLIYTLDDMFADNMLAHINGLLQETYAIEATSVCHLSPTTRQLFTPDDYPERFFRWADRLMDFTRQQL